MAANLPPNLASSKSAAAAGPPALNSSPSQASAASSGDSHAQRRSGGSGSFGAGAATRAVNNAAPRNKQAARHPHKNSRKFRFTDEDAIAESAAMNSTRNRKGQTSITHLMNFSLPPRPSQFQHQHLHNNSRHPRRNPTWGLGSGHHAVDKARYVHANYRFVVDPRRDYHAQSVDADVYLDWASILQILASPQSQAAACPICLGDPVAPRMAKCGHMFCLHCLIRYMHSTDDSDHHAEKRPRWKKCPICWDAIYISETRPVRWYIGQEGPIPHEKEDIVLRLVKRPAGSTLALPRDVQAMAADEDIPWHFAANVMDYARFMKGSEDYMLAQYDVEIAQLEEVERHDELMFGEDTEWTNRAIRAVNDAKEKIKGLGNPPSPLLKPEEPKPQKRPPPSTDLHQDTPDMYILQHAAKSGQSIPYNAPPQKQPETPEPDALPLAPSDSTIQPKSALSTSLAEFRARQHATHAPSDYYFYQALLHYYLSPLDIRILKVAFGEFAIFPSTILPRVERVSTGHVVDDELRRRAKYLSHLPYGCEVGFLECDWTDTVPAEVLEKFKPDIERRRKKNSDKEAREDKERARAEKEEEDKRYAAARRKRPTSPSRHQFQPGDFQPLAVSQDTEATTNVAQSLESGSGTGGGNESTSPVWPPRAENGASFASLGSPSTSPSTSRTVWGTTAVAPTSPTLAMSQTTLAARPPPADDGWLQGWERDLLSEEDLVSRVQAASLVEDHKPVGNPAPGSAGKKKKGKKITLMSTSSARRGA